MAAGGHFGGPKFTFNHISRHFRSISNFFVHKMATEGHFGYPKITFDRISRHFRSIPNFHLFLNLFTKWPPAAMFLSPQEISLAYNLGLLRIVWYNISDIDHLLKLFQIMYIIHYILDITEIVVCPLACWESSLNKCLNQRLECSLEMGARGIRTMVYYTIRKGCPTHTRQHSSLTPRSYNALRRRTTTCDG